MVSTRARKKTHIEGNAIDFEELKISEIIIKIDKFGVGFKLNDERHIGVFFNDNSNMTLDVESFSLTYISRDFEIQKGGWKNLTI